MKAENLQKCNVITLTLQDTPEEILMLKENYSSQEPWRILQSEYLDYMKYYWLLKIAVVKS